MVFIGHTEETDCFMWETHDIYRYYLDISEASKFLLMNCISVNGFSHWNSAFTFWSCVRQMQVSIDDSPNGIPFRVLWLVNQIKLVNIFYKFFFSSSTNLILRLRSILPTTFYITNYVLLISASDNGAHEPGRFKSPGMLRFVNWWIFTLPQQIEYLPARL